MVYFCIVITVCEKMEYKSGHTEIQLLLLRSGIRRGVILCQVLYKFSLSNVTRFYKLHRLLQFTRAVCTALLRQVAVNSCRSGVRNDWQSFLVEKKQYNKLLKIKL